MSWGSETPLVEQHGWQQNGSVHVTKIVWCEDRFAFAFGDGAVAFGWTDALHDTIKAHEDSCLAAASLNDQIVTASDDGRVVATRPNGEQDILFEQFGRFFDQLATASWGGVAFADGRRIFALVDGKTREYKASGTVGGLSFAPKGRKLAASRNNGASVYWVGIDRDTPDDYEWQGAHGAVTWSGNGNFLVTSMHENALHVWRTDKKKHGRMGGYPTRIKSFSWNPKGQHLATAGADGVIIWPFNSKDGPIGQAADQIPLKEGVIVAQVAWHPVNDVFAVGTDQGDVLIMRRDNAIMPIAMGLGSAVTTLCWDKVGSALAFGTDGGVFGVGDFSHL